MGDQDEIKAAVQELFGVRVDKVRTQNRLGKQRRYRFKRAGCRTGRRRSSSCIRTTKIEFF